MLIGEYHHNLDEKGRLIIPSKFRNDLGKKFIVTRGIEKCLFIYSLDDIFGRKVGKHQVSFGCRKWHSFGWR